MNNVDRKRQQEKEIVTMMIKLYCKKKHGANSGKKGELCPSCQEVHNYAILRLDNCPFMETKTFCSNCRVHCYKPEMREKIREIMRFSGPRLIFYHPVTVIRHMLESIKK